MMVIIRCQFPEPVLFSAHYNCAYANIPSPFWWDQKHAGGPIVEQATHFVRHLDPDNGDDICDSGNSHFPLNV